MNRNKNLIGKTEPRWRWWRQQMKHTTKLRERERVRKRGKAFWPTNSKWLSVFFPLSHCENFDFRLNFNVHFGKPSRRTISTTQYVIFFSVRLFLFHWIWAFAVNFRCSHPIAISWWWLWVWALCTAFVSIKLN